MRKTTSSLLIFLSLTLCGTISFSQSFVAGYIVTTKGDTIRGFIKETIGGRSPANLSYKKNLADNESVSYSPDLLNAFHFQESGESYLSAEVEIDMKPTETTRLEEDRYPKFVKERVFLKVVVYSKASLFYLSDRTTKQHYFLQYDNGEIKELQLIVYFHRARNIQVTSEVYKEQLKQTLLGCDIDFMKVNYTESSLKKAVMAYNTCTGSISGSTEKPKTANKLSYYIIGGVALGMGSYNGPDFNAGTFFSYDASAIDFDLSISPLLGFGMELFTGKAPVSVGGELTWRMHSFTGISPAQRTAEFAFSAVKLNLLGTYHFGKSSSKPYFRVGPSLAYVSVTKNVFHKEKLNDFFKLNLAAVLGVGVDTKRWEVELRYEYTPITASYGKFHLNDLIFMLGYKLGNK